MRTREGEVVVVGSGVAGLTFALQVADAMDIVLITKKHRAESNTNYAQGGIAAVMADEDSYELHVRDTLRAGAGLCDEAAVRDLVREGPARVRELIDWGVNFSRTGERLNLGREGGHSRRRIVHALDRTGRAIEHALLESVSRHPNVEVLEDHLAVDLLVGKDTGGRSRCAGMLVLNRTTGEPWRFLGHWTVLATGGLGHVYRHTTNPAIATGDGVAMAYRAGARVANLEFIQFHPTALYPAEHQAILISEAVRGEGAILRTIDGRALMEAHPDGSLATRDVVARAIDLELKKSGASHALLDLSPIPTARIARRFPNIAADCAARGIDIRTDPIPVVPAAHYSCGGVASDRNGGTSLPGLFVAGEVACTGVHGANRLASNSLLEAVVYSHRAAETINSRRSRGREPASSVGIPGMEHESLAEYAEDPRTDELEPIESRARSIMWENAGIVRSDARLANAAHRLEELEKEVRQRFQDGPLTAPLLELRNLVTTSLLIVRCATSRKESRGLHFNVDHPQTDPALATDTVLSDERRPGDPAS